MDENLNTAVMKAVADIRAEQPLVGSITNMVTIDFVANAQLAVGGSAAMVYLPDEGEHLAKAAGAFYMNMGTLLPVHEESLPRTAQALADSATPWVLDPVGIGIGHLREQLLLQLARFKPSIVRGNASEIIALAQLWGLECGSANATVRGVDATDEVASAIEAAHAIAAFTDGAVAVSGPVDVVVDAARAVRLSGGSTIMAKITGSGCSLGGVAAVYAAVTSPFAAAVSAVAHYNVAGSRAAAHTAEPGTFKVAFIDELHRATATDIAACPRTWIGA